MALRRLDNRGAGQQEPAAGPLVLVDQAGAATVIVALAIRRGLAVAARFGVAGAPPRDCVFKGLAR